MSNDTPLVPRVGEVHYLVLDDVGRYGRVYRETEEREADEATVVTYILDGQYKKPVRVIAFDLSAGWVRDATADVALAVLKRARSEHRLIGISAGEFIELALGPNAAE
jgi:hypothetical protein